MDPVVIGWLAISVPALLGVALGFGMCYLLFYRPLWRSQTKLTEHVVTMRKQGFVPQFELAQRSEPDPSKGVRER